MASIIVAEVTGHEKYYALGKRTLVIGRGEQVDVQIVDDLISVKHVQIRFDESEGSYHALDMRSKNGTRINSRAIDGDTMLEDGDVIRIGESTITFYDRDFTDKQDAFQHNKKAGERRRSTATRRV